MKFLIWIICVFITAFLNFLIEDFGIKGAIPTMVLCGLMVWSARNLCKKWDKHKESKSIKKINNNGMEVDDIHMSISNINENIKKTSKGTCSSDVLLVKEEVSFVHDDMDMSEDLLKENKEIDEILETEDKENKRNVHNKRYCFKCGSIIDNETQKCTGCGKQYFDFMYNVKFNICIVVGIVVLWSVILTIQQKQEPKKYEEQIKQEQIERVKSNNPDNRISYDVSKIRIVEDGYAEAGMFSEMISDTKYLIHSNNLGDTFEVEYKVIGGMKVGSTNYSLEGDGTLSVASVKYEKAKDYWYKVTLSDGKGGFIWGGTDGIYVEEIE